MTNSYLCLVLSGLPWTCGLLWESLLQWHWPITPDSASQVPSPLKLDSNFSFWPLEQERVSHFCKEGDTWWEQVWIDPPAFIHNHRTTVTAYILLHQIWNRHWSRVFKGPVRPLLPQDHGLSLGQHCAAVWDGSAQDGGQRSPTGQDQEQRPPAKALL